MIFTIDGFFAVFVIGFAIVFAIGGACHFLVNLYIIARDLLLRHRK